jgi:DNA-binding NtrC family response regulator
MKKTIMIITPRNHQRMALEGLLRNAGFKLAPGVGKLDELRHALDANETHPNVIMVDFWLSKGATIDLIQRLKAQGFAVILMGNQGLGQQIAKSQRILFLAKPFSTSDMVKAIELARA